MGSGAYSVFIDQQAPGGGPPGSLRRVVPLPPPELSGAVKFTTVVLSLAYCMSSEHFVQFAWQFKRVSGSSGLKVQAAIAC